MVTVLSHWLLYTTEHLFCRLWQWRWCKAVITSQVLDRGGFVGCHCHKVVVVVIKRWTVLSYHRNVIYIYWQPCVCSAACRLACSGGVYIRALYLWLVISSGLDATLVRAYLVALCSHACWLSSSSLLSCCRCSWERSCCCGHDAALRKCIHEWANLLRCLQVLWWDGWTPHASICHHAHLGNVLEKLLFSNYNFIILEWILGKLSLLWYFPKEREHRLHTIDTTQFILVGYIYTTGQWNLSRLSSLFWDNKLVHNLLAIIHRCACAIFASRHS